MKKRNNIIVTCAITEEKKNHAPGCNRCATNTNSIPSVDRNKWAYDRTSAVVQLFLSPFYSPRKNQKTENNRTLCPQRFFKNNHKICRSGRVRIFEILIGEINDSSRDVCCTTRNEESWTPVFSFSCWTSVHIHCHMLRGHCCQTANAILPNGTDAGQLCRSRCCCTSKVELFFSSFFFLHPSLFATRANTTTLFSVHLMPHRECCSLCANCAHTAVIVDPCNSKHSQNCNCPVLVLGIGFAELVPRTMRPCW